MHRCAPAALLLAAVLTAACSAPAAGPGAVPESSTGIDLVALGPEATRHTPRMEPLLPAAAIDPAASPTAAASATPFTLGSRAYPEPATATRTATLRPGITPSATRATATTRPTTLSSSGSGPGVPTSTRGPTRTPRPTEVQATRTPTEDRRPITLLRRGGLVIYLRHAHTDWEQNDRELEWIQEVLADLGNDDLFDDCDRQRLLTEEGRAEAQAIGEAIRSLGIPIGSVRTSRWCRVRDTAELAFGGGEADGDSLFDSGYLPAGSEERKELSDRLRQLLSESPGEGSNSVLVGHMPQLLDAAGLSLQEGEAAIFQPADGSFKLLTRVSPGGWAALGP